LIIERRVGEGDKGDKELLAKKGFQSGVGINAHTNSRFDTSFFTGASHFCEFVV
jgi:hypothetical protein